MKCEICNKVIKGKINHLGYHLKMSHGITYKEYYDTFLKTEKDGICIVCGKATKWKRNSYTKTCSHKCGTLCSQDKRETTMLERYKGKTTLESQELKEQMQKTCEQRYGNKNPGKFGGEIFEAAMEDKYGVKSYLSTFTEEERAEYNKRSHTKEAQDKYKKTMQELYGVEHPTLSRSITLKMKKKYIFDDKNFDSGSELIYYIWLKENNIPFEYHPNIDLVYEYNGEDKHYFPDFKVNGELQEIKGLQFFENKDINGKMYCPYHYPNDTEEIIKQRNEIYEAKHQCMIKNKIKIVTDVSEYEQYVYNKYTKDFINLFKTNLKFPYLNEDFKDTSDIGIIQHFHKSIYEAKRYNELSPIEAWENKNIIYKVALNRLKYKQKCSPSDILQGFNVTKLAPKVSVFKPKLAEELIKKYLNEYDTIFDPFSGFSGRMIGAKNCGKKYIGQDINKKHVVESNDIIKYKNYTDCNVIEQDIITDDFKEYECLFTCSPYGLKEIWNETDVNKTCDEWIDICLTKYKCKRYCFVVDCTEKYKNNIVEEITNHSHFGTNKEYVVLI